MDQRQIPQKINEEAGIKTIDLKSTIVFLRVSQGRLSYTGGYNKTSPRLFRSMLFFSNLATCHRVFFFFSFHHYYLIFFPFLHCIIREKSMNKWPRVNKIENCLRHDLDLFRDELEIGQTCAGQEKKLFLGEYFPRRYFCSIFFSTSSRSPA